MENFIRAIVRDELAQCGIEPKDYVDDLIDEAVGVFIGEQWSLCPTTADSANLLHAIIRDVIDTAAVCDCCR
jgi:hypothetical protein